MSDQQDAGQVPEPQGSGSPASESQTPEPQTPESASPESELYDAGPEEGFGEIPDLDAELAHLTAETQHSDELAERTADLQRVTAEYANYRKRMDRERQNAIAAAKAGVLGELLAVIDDLDRARAHGDLESGPLKAIAEKLAGVFDKQGVVEFGTVGEAFDPAVHEAVQHEGEGHHPVVSAVFRKGYRIGDRVLRVAMVAVGDGDSADDAGESDAGESRDSAGQ